MRSLTSYPSFYYIYILPSTRWPFETKTIISYLCFNLNVNQKMPYEYKVTATKWRFLMQDKCSPFTHFISCYLPKQRKIPNAYTHSILNKLHLDQTTHTTQFAFPVTFKKINKTKLYHHKNNVNNEPYATPPLSRPNFVLVYNNTFLLPLNTKAASRRAL